MTTPEQPTTTPDATPSIIEVVSDTLPDFLTSDPYLWFVQLEATFADRASETIKHKKCVSKLPQIVLPQVSDLLTASTSYKELKERLLTLYGKSKETLISNLLNGIRMGDEKPSMLLRRMQYMAGSSDADEYLKSLWLRALPTGYRLQLALSSATSLTDLATEADKLAAAAALNNIPDESSAKIAALTDQEDGRERMLDEEEGKVDIEDIEEEVPRSILKKRHRAKGSLCRRICNYLRSAWTGVKFSLEAEAEEGEPLPPRARPDSLRSLTKATRFTEQELKRIYRGFKAECPSGLVREDTFRSIYSQFFPQGANSSQYATYVFHTLDQANSGTLSFQDLVRGLSVLCRGSVEERLKWTFTLYDINKDGKITRDELADVITSVYSLLGRLSPHHGEEENDPLSSKIDVIFQRLDQNKDGVVTWEEFFDACTSDETITSSMAVFDSAI